MTRFGWSHDDRGGKGKGGSGKTATFAVDEPDEGGPKRPGGRLKRLATLSSFGAHALLADPVRAQRQTTVNDLGKSDEEVGKTEDEDDGPTEEVTDAFAMPEDEGLAPHLRAGGAARRMSMKIYFQIRRGSTMLAGGAFGGAWGGGGGGSNAGGSNAGGGLAADSFKGRMSAASPPTSFTKKDERLSKARFSDALVGGGFVLGAGSQRPEGDDGEGDDGEAEAEVEKEEEAHGGAGGGEGAGKGATQGATQHEAQQAQQAQQVQQAQQAQPSATGEGSFKGPKPTLDTGKVKKLASKGTGASLFSPSAASLLSSKRSRNDSVRPAVV